MLAVHSRRVHLARFLNESYMRQDCASATLYILAMSFWFWRVTRDPLTRTSRTAKKVRSKAWYIRACRTVREPNVQMCRWDCEPALHHPWMVCIPFAANQNLSVFCTNTKRTGCTRCPFHAPSVLCLPQVRRKLINHAPNTHHTQTVQHVSGTLVYTRFNKARQEHPMLHKSVRSECFHLHSRFHIVSGSLSKRVQPA